MGGPEAKTTVKQEKLTPPEKGFNVYSSAAAQLNARGFSIRIEQPSSHSVTVLDAASESVTNLFQRVAHTQEVGALSLISSNISSLTPDMSRTSWDDVTRARILAKFYQTQSENYTKAIETAEAGMSKGILQARKDRADAALARVLPDGESVPTIDELVEFTTEVVTREIQKPVPNLPK